MKLIYLSTARIPDDWAHVLQILTMCEAFADAGAEVELVVPRRSATKAQDPFGYAGVKENFKITRLWCLDFFPGKQGTFFYGLRTFSFFLSAWYYLLRNRVDYIYTREVSAWIPVRNTVFELHTISPSTARYVPRLNAACGVITISEGIRTDLIALGVSGEKILTAPDGVRLADFAHPESKEVARSRLGLPRDACLAVYIGLLNTWKGVETLYAAAPLLAPDIRLVLIGEDWSTPLEQLRTAHPLITFLGFRPYTELADNQSVADVLVLPNSGQSALSAKYTSPLKLFSYMASGKPVVASNLSSLREILSEQNAFLVAPDDPAALAAGIRTALAHPEEARQRAGQALHDVQSFSWELRAERILKFITNV